MKYTAKYPAGFLAAVLAAALLPAAGCLPEESAMQAPAAFPEPQPLKPVPLVPPEVAAARKEQAEREKKIQKFQSFFSPEMRESLDFMEWGPLPEGTKVPVLSYQNLPTECQIKYVQNTTYRYENDLFGMLKADTNTSFYLDIVKNPKTGALSAAYTPRHLSIILIAPNKTDTMFYDSPKSRLKKQKFSLDAPEKFFSYSISPAFFININTAVGKPRGKIKYPAESVAPLFQFLPPLPTESAPGSTADWNYAPVFDPNKPADKHGTAKVELLTWLRVRDQKAALLRATWPGEEREWPSAVSSMNVFILKDRKKVDSFLRQSGPAQADFIVAENGLILMAHFKGATVVSTENEWQGRAFSRRKMRYEQTTRKITEVERGYFSAFLRAVGDCSGDFIKPLEPELLKEDEIQTLTEDFISKYSIGRKKEALALISPEQRVVRSDEYLMMYLDEFFKLGGVDTFGRPEMMVFGKTEEGETMPIGLSWRGFNKKLNINTYSISIGLRIHDKPYLTFLGISSKPIKEGMSLRKHPFDILEVSDERITTLVEHKHSRQDE